MGVGSGLFCFFGRTGGRVVGFVTSIETEEAESTGVMQFPFPSRFVLLHKKKKNPHASEHEAAAVVTRFVYGYA